MKISTPIILTLILVLMLSCGDKTSNEKNDINRENKELSAEQREEQALYNELMSVHDEAMPKMDKIMRLKSDLKQQLEELEGQEPADSTRMQKIENALIELESASEGMMQWMRDFEPISEGEKTHEETIAYYKEKKTAIKKVSEDINHVIEEAKKLLEE